MKIAVLDDATFFFPKTEWEFLREFGEYTLLNTTPTHDEHAIIKNCADYEIILTNKVPLSRNTIQQLPSLKYIGVLATGYNIIDTTSAKEHGITVTNIPAYSTPSVVQQTIALILELCNQVGRHDYLVHQGEWQRSPLFCFWESPIYELEGLTIGIIGLGTIGLQVAKILETFGCKIIGVGRSHKEIHELTHFHWVTLEEALRTADIITLHCPQTEQTRHMINATTLTQMKPTAFLINTSRGGLIDEAALANALRQKTIAGAALDVLSTEPMTKDCPLMDAPNCIITPHMAWGSTASRKRLMKIAADNIRSYLAKKPKNVVGS